jgi:single-stranded-DNA-specific exonuclease
MPALAPAAKPPGRLFLGVEQSVCGRAWRDRLDERGAARALAIAQRHDLPELLARILAGRGVEPEEVESFLDPAIKRLLPDPHVLTAMEAGAARVADAIQRNESTAIFGDYDVDGATSSALLARYLRDCGLDPLIHIPDRLFEGYGPNVDAVRSLADRGATLLITVDCGTVSLEPLAEANRIGMQVVVIDHHQAGDELPEAVAVINPNRVDDRRPRLPHPRRPQSRAAAARFLRDAARARSALDAASRGARHRGRRGAADRAQPRFCVEGPDRAAPA